MTEKKNKNPTNKVYKIKSIEDIFNLPTKENILDCLEDLKECLIKGREIEEKIKFLGFTIPYFKIREVNWKDDGLREVKINLSNVFISNE